MTAVIEYCPEYVNTLLPINESHMLDLEEDALKCGQVLCANGVQEYIAVHRLHQHYHLNDGERVVATQHTTADSRWVRDATSSKPMLKKRPMALNDDSLAAFVQVPYIFRFLATGKVVPLEFFAGTAGEPLTEQLRENAAKAMGASALHEELFEMLISLGREEHLGFQLVFEESLLQGAHGEIVLEANWNRYQEVIYTNPEIGFKFTVTSWRFASDGQPRKAGCKCVDRVYCQRTQTGHMSLSDGHNEYN